VDLSAHWSLIVRIATKRLENNKTSFHVSEFGEKLEVLGAAGEVAARLFLGASLDLNTHFDGGVDIYYGQYKIDVKATELTPGFQYKFLQWPELKKLKADILVMTGVNLETKHAAIIGYVTAKMMQGAPINRSRPRPCMEIPLLALLPPWELVVQEQIGERCQIVGRPAYQGYEQRPG
jgi:hypothetical protein